MAKILVVEDTGLWQKTIGDAIRELGHEVLGPASTEWAALNLFRSQHPDLVTMDGSLVGGDRGLKIAATMRAENPDVPIIMITLHGDEKFEGYGMSKGDWSRGEFNKLVTELLA